VVADVHAGEAAGLGGDVVVERRGVPEVPHVELDSQCRRIARLLDQRDGLGDRRRDRPELAAVALVRLEPDPHAEPVGLVRDRPEAVDDDAPCLVGIAALGGPGQADEGARPERREPLEARAVRLDALRRILGAAEKRQRQDRRDRRDGRRGAEAARLEQLERLGVAALRQLQLPDAEPGETGVGVEPNVVGKARPDRRDLRDRDSRLHALDLLMRFDI
jgi:hypothetical protein